MQPDSLIPGASNPQNFNRFSYVQNNPVRFNDPSGHYQCEDDPCENPVSTLSDYRISTHGLDEDERWEAVSAARLAGSKLDDNLDSDHRYSPEGIFKMMHGSFSITLDSSRGNCETEGASIKCGSNSLYMTAFLHEFGHIMDNHFHLRPSDIDPYYDIKGNPIDGGDYWKLLWEGFKCKGDWACSEHPASLGYGEACNNPQSLECIKAQKMEHWADLYMNWVLDVTE